MKFLIGLFLSSCIFCVSEAKLFVANEELPSELRFLVSSIQKIDLSENEQSIFQNNLLAIDSYLSGLTKEDIYFLTKAEIYKTILHFKSNEKSNSEFGPHVIDSLSKKLSSHENQYTPFSIWLIQAIRSDLRIINESVPTTKTTLPLDTKKKLALLMPWYESIMFLSAKEFDQSIKPLLFQSLSRIRKTYHWLIAFTSFTKLDSKKNLSELKNFSIIEVQEKEKEEKPESKLENILSEIDNLSKDSETQNDVKNEWVPKSDSLGPKEDRPSIIKSADPSYKKPESLPSPVDDWIFDI